MSQATMIKSGLTVGGDGQQKPKPKREQQQQKTMPAKKK